MFDSRAAAVMMAGAFALVSGCGTGNDFANNPRPPTYLNLAATIDANRVLVSPSHLGAGPVMFIVANQTSSSQQLIISSDQPGLLRDQTAPINPGSTVSMQADLRTGGYTVRVADPAIQSVSIRVGAERPSAKGQLLLP